MSVTYPAGFRAAAANMKLKDSGTPDMALVVNDGRQPAAAAVFTANRCKANPVLYSQQALEAGQGLAVVLNSGGANCFTGDYGYETSRLTAEATATGLGMNTHDVLVCSTGLIGVGGADFRQKVLTGATRLAATATATPEAGAHAAEAILTTDTRAKTTTLQRGSVRIGAMAKGAGMLAPGLATMLVVITTDAVLSSAQADTCLRQACAASFDRLDTDGCMSTNDTVILMCSGESGHSPNPQEFTQDLTVVCTDLAEALMRDAEGAKHYVIITTCGAATEEEAVEVSRAVARSALLKTAIYGEDPNWGRVVAQVGTTRAQFDPQNIDVSFNGVMVCEASAPAEPPSAVTFSPEVNITINLHAGDASASVWTTDLTHDYVTENSVYST